VWHLIDWSLSPLFEGHAVSIFRLDLRMQEYIFLSTLHCVIDIPRLMGYILLVFDRLWT
jgi:hypothetical protein